MNSPGVSGGAWPLAVQARAISAGMSPGARNASASGSKSGTSSRASSASRLSSSYSRPKLRLHSWTSQSPITLRSNRIVPSTPRSFVRLNAAASGVSTGSSSSRPSNDHVPDERTAACGVRSGAATNADAVSWPATACT